MAVLCLPPVLCNRLRCFLATSRTCANLQDPEGSGEDPTVQRLFGVGLHTRFTCAESGEAEEEDATAFELKCNITSEVNLLSEGLRLGLVSDREKNSAALERLALFQVPGLEPCDPRPRPCDPDPIARAFACCLRGCLGMRSCV